jgi:hypothetical protein
VFLCVVVLESRLADSFQELYHKTSYDAGVRYSILLEELEINLESSSFDKFLQIIKNPAFRDRIYTIYIYTPECPDSDPGLPSKNPSAEELAFNKAAEDFRSSNEAINRLAECFRHLEKAKSLQRIELCSNRGHDMVLRAMSLAAFSRQLAYFGIEPKQLSKLGYGMLSTSPKDCVRYIKGLQIQPMMSDPEAGHEHPADQREENVMGLHIKNYRPTTVEFTDLVIALLSVGTLEYNGCRAHPKIRFCHACDDLFARVFARTVFPNLSCLTITSTFMSGGRLRKFVKCHATTLTYIDMTFVSLTDGTWRSIAQGFAKLLRLQTLKLSALRQKSRAAKITGQTTRPPQYTNTFQVTFEDANHVKQFLKIFIVFFSTVQYLNPGRFKRTPPMYHEARLFDLPETSEASSQIGSLKAVSVLRTYAEESGVC